MISKQIQCATKKVLLSTGLLLLTLFLHAQNPNFEPGVQKIYNIGGRDWLIWIPTNITVKHRLLVSTTGNGCNTLNDAINQGPAKEINNVTSGIHRDNFVVATMIRKTSENGSVASVSDINAGLDIIYQYGSAFICSNPGSAYFTGLSQGAQEMYRYLSNWCTVFSIGCNPTHREKFRGQVAVIPGAFDSQFYTTFKPQYNWINWGTADPLAFWGQAAFDYFNAQFPAPKTKGSVFNGVGHSLSISDAAWNSSGTSASTNTWRWMLNEYEGNDLKVSLKVYLQGAYNTTTGLMNDNLRSLGLIPVTEPYTGMTNFTHVGGGGGESVSSTAFATTGTPANDIVDWVFVQLHNGTTGAVIATKSALIQRDGDIVSYNSGSCVLSDYVSFGGFPAGNYYVSVRHRNHLGVRTASTMALSNTSVASYNFTTSLSQAFAGSVSNDAMATISGSVYAMWGGNANRDNQVRYAGPSAINDNFFLLTTTLGGNQNATISGYLTADMNMNGVVNYLGNGNDNLFLLNQALSGVTTNIRTQPF